MDAVVARHLCNTRARPRRLIENPVFIYFAEPPPMTLAWPRNESGLPAKRRDKPRGLGGDLRED
jgi:hypothetical protein